MIFKDYYKILNLKNNQVTAEEIKQAYREQAKKYHPDIDKTGEFSEERFKDINEAYKVLSDQSAKRKYDRMWNTHVGKKQRKTYEESSRQNGSIFSEFFKMFFGENKIEKNETNSNAKKIPIKGENVETQINISITEAFYGAKKKISLRTLEGNMKTFEVKIPIGIRNGEKIRLMGQGKLRFKWWKARRLINKIKHRK